MKFLLQKLFIIVRLKMGSIRNYTIIYVKLFVFSMITMGIIWLDYASVLVNQSQIAVSFQIDY